MFLDAFFFFMIPVFATLINSELSFGRKDKAFFLSFWAIIKFIFFIAFLNLLFLNLFTVVCLEILRTLLIADFVFAIRALV